MSFVKYPSPKKTWRRSWVCNNGKSQLVVEYTHKAKVCLFNFSALLCNSLLLQPQKGFAEESILKCNNNKKKTTLKQ